MRARMMRINMKRYNYDNLEQYDEFGDRIAEPWRELNPYDSPQLFLDIMEAKGKTFNLVFPYAGLYKVSEFVCQKCLSVFSMTPKEAYSKDCPHCKGSGKDCNNRGYNTHKTGFLYVYKFLDFYGFGITNNLTSRGKQHTATFKALGIPHELVKVVSGSGESIRSLEAKLKKTLNIVNTGVEGFKTEAVYANDSDELFEALLQFK